MGLDKLLEMVKQQAGLEHQVNEFLGMKYHNQIGEHNLGIVTDLRMKLLSKVDMGQKTLYQ